MIASEMPGHAGSPYWAAVDFDSEGDDVPSPPPNHRVYLDPWDNEANVMQPQDQESSQDENFNSFAGEPVSASFYYVPTKNYDSGEEPPLPPPRRKTTLREDNGYGQDYSVYGRKMSRTVVPDMPEHAIYGERQLRDRRRSVYIEEPIYVPHPMAPMMYEPLYGVMPPPPPPGFVLPPRPRTRVSLPNQPEYNPMPGLGYGKRRHSRLADAYESFVYENQSPEYEDWARPFPKTAPDNFHLSRYGHLQIDYSLSWHSLDRLIRNQ